MLLLIIYFVTRNSFLNSKEIGGQYLLMKSANKEIIPSVSQIDLYIKFNFDKYWNLALKRLKDRTEIKIDNEKYDIPSAHHPSYISDANIDLLYLYNQKMIKKGLAMCEFNPKTHRCGNNLVTLIENNRLLIKHPLEVEKNLNAIKKSDVRIYIEFVYSKFDNINTAYKHVHEKTFEILASILLSKTNNIKNRIYIYRVYVEHDKIINSNKPLINKRQIFIESFDKHSVFPDKFNSLVIPLTKKENGCNFDEYLYFETQNGITFDVQIEHSEGLDSHKTDLLIFLLENISNIQLITSYLKLMGYTMKNEKFNYELKGDESKTSLENSYAYNLKPNWFKKYIEIN